MAAISMRRTKLKAEEAALLAGELSKPSWESRNEGIHERVSFEDTIWGFDLAGGAYYRTPLRVTFVKPDSRAEKAGIRPGDRLLKINGIDTSTMTIQEAHDMIVKSGIHLSLSVTAPEDEVDAVFYYEDPLLEDPEEEERRRIEEEKARRRRIHAKVNHNWSLQWPWVSKRRIIWRESNCYMVPSKYEDKHRDKFPPQPMIRTSDDIVLHSAKDTSKNRVRGQKISQDSEKIHEPTVENNVESDTEDISESISNVSDDVTEGPDANAEENDQLIEQDINSKNEPLEEARDDDRSDINSPQSENYTDTVENKKDEQSIVNDNGFHETDDDTENNESLKNSKNTDVNEFSDLVNGELTNEADDNEIIDNVLSNGHETKEEADSNNVESMVENGDHTSEKKVE